LDGEVKNFIKTNTPRLKLGVLLDPGGPAPGLRREERVEQAVGGEPFRDRDLGIPVPESLHRGFHAAQLLAAGLTDGRQMAADLLQKGLLAEQRGDVGRLQVLRLVVFRRAWAQWAHGLGSPGLAAVPARRTSSLRKSRADSTARSMVSPISSSLNGASRLLGGRDCLLMRRTLKPRRTRDDHTDFGFASRRGKIMDFVHSDPPCGNFILGEPSCCPALPGQDTLRE
jgi:hypothetical protein